jgi:hypothetical protein
VFVALALFGHVLLFADHWRHPAEREAAPKRRMLWPAE